jgi:iron complex outermembrane receptor protein
VTEGLHLQGLGGGVFGGFGANHPADAFDLRMNSMEDESIEFRLSSSDDQSFRWMIGYSQLDMEWFTQVIGNLIVYYPSSENNATRQAAGQMPVCYNPYWPFYGAGLAGSNACGAYGDTTSNNNDMKWDSVDNSAFYAAVEYDISDTLTLSVDIRRQEDEITTGGVGAYTGDFPKTLGSLANQQNGTFKRTLPRVILDYKPNEDTTMYFTYSEGSLPGTFNPSLATLTESQLAEIAQQTGGAAIEVDEEVSENIEFGIKRTILDGRGFVSVAIYDTDLTNVHTPFFSPTYTDADGNQALLSGNITSQGGNANLSGIEVDGTVILNDLWSVDFTYAMNDSEIGAGFQSADTFDLDGDRLAAVGNMFSRYPKNSGSLSFSYAKENTADREVFARIDTIYTGKMWASNAMHAHTGSGTKFNLRGGFETDSYRVELYCTNCFDDSQPKGLQQLYDLSGITGGFGDGAVTAGGMRVVSIALADKRTVGIRASYKF